MLIRCCIDRLSWHLFRGKEFLPGLLAENRDGNGSLPRSRNLISEKVFTRPSTLYGRGRADIHHGPESVTPLKAEYIGADQLPLFVFRLQLCGGPYIPISRPLRALTRPEATTLSREIQADKHDEERSA